MRYRRLMTALAIVLVPTFASGDPLPRFTDDLTLGSQGGDVPALQTLLLSQSPPLYTGAVTGIYDATTQDAVQRFQLKVGLSDPAISGTVEATTRDYLNAAADTRTSAQFNADILAWEQTRIDDPAVMLKDRYFQMQLLLIANPQQALAVRLTKSQRSRVPLAERVWIEQDVSLHGRLMESHLDHPELSFAPTMFRLYTIPHGTVYRTYSGDPRLFQPSSKASLRGIALGDLFVPNPTLTGVKLTRPRTSAAQSAAPNVLVLLITFPDAPPPDNSPATLMQRMVTVHDFYRENAFAAPASPFSNLTYQVVGWEMSRQPYTSYDCGNPKVDSFGAILREAIALADPSVDFSRFTNILLLLNQNAQCNLRGSGFAGYGPGVFATADGTFPLFIAVGPEGAIPWLAVHELGHNFGLHHVHNIDCHTAPLVSDPLNPINCTASDYGDDYDPMGGPIGSGQLTPIHKMNLGMFAGTQVLQTVAQSGTYTLAPYETGGGVKALTLPRANGGALWVEYRRPVGFDADPFFLGDGNYPPTFQDGAMVRVSFGVPDPYTAPGAGFSLNTSYIVRRRPDDLIKSHLYFGVGETMYDPDGKWVITPTAITATSLSVRTDQIDPLGIAITPTGPTNPDDQLWGGVTEGPFYRFYARGGVGPYSWSIPGAVPPTGTTLTTTDPYIFDTPTPGVYTITLSLTQHHLSYHHDMSVFVCCPVQGDPDACTASLSPCP